ncbi:catalase [Rhodococcus hoagii]|nr:catalase [Prescottella equi]
MWEEAQIAAGVDPDFHRRTWPTRSRAVPTRSTLGVQVFPDTPNRNSRVSTCSIPPSSCPRSWRRCNPIGVMTLNANPTNYFAETEQVPSIPATWCRHRRHRRPPAAGPPLLLPRHPDQPTRWTQLRAAPDQSPARAGQRHAAGRHAPDGCPRRGRALQAEQPRRWVPVHRRAGPGFVDVAGADRGDDQAADQAELVRRPLQPAATVLHELSEVEQRHLADAYSFELGKCFEQPIRNVPSRCSHASTRPCASGSLGRWACLFPEVADSATVICLRARARPVPDRWRVAGRGPKRSVLVDEGSAADSVEACSRCAFRPRSGPVGHRSERGTTGARGQRCHGVPDVRHGPLDRVRCRPVPDTEPDGRVVRLLDEAFRHGKAVGADSNGAEGLASGAREKPGVHVGDDLRQ